MRQLVIIQIVTALSGWVLSSAAFAMPVEGTSVEIKSTESAPVAAAAAVPVQDAKPVAEARRDCIRESGTRIVRRDKDGCNGMAGRSYSQEDLRRTGDTNIADALQRLDPAIGRQH